MFISIAFFSKIGDGSQYWIDLFLAFRAFFAIARPVMQLTPNIFSCVRGILSYSSPVLLKATVMKFSSQFLPQIFHARFQLRIDSS